MSNKKELEHKLEKQLDALSDKIDQLAAKLKEQEVKAGELEHQAVDKLKAMRATAKEKLKAFKEAEHENLHEVQTSLTEYWNSLGAELKAYDSL